MELTGSLALDSPRIKQRSSYSPATQSSIYHFDNDICRCLDFRNRSIFNGYDVGFFKYNGFHCVFSHCLSGSSRPLSLESEIVKMERCRN